VSLAVEQCVDVCRVVGLNRCGDCLTDRSLRPLRRINHSKKVRLKQLSSSDGTSYGAKPGLKNPDVG